MQLSTKTFYKKSKATEVECKLELAPLLFSTPAAEPSKSLFSFFDFFTTTLTVWGLDRLRAALPGR